MVRLGVLGATRGLEFAFAAQKYGIDCRLAAVCETFPPLAEKVKAGLAERGFVDVGFFADFQEMLAADIDAVVIANNATEHAPFAVAALSAGKHVLSEVLPVQTPAQAVALCEAVETSGHIYRYAENYCYFPANHEAARRYKAGEIGDIVEAECDFINDCSGRWELLTRGLRNHWRNHVPATFYCTHSIGPLLYTLGLRPVKVAGYEMRNQEYMRSRGARSGSAALEIIELENGVYLKSLHGNLRRPWCTRMNLYGTKGSLEVTNGWSLVKYTVKGPGSQFDCENIDLSGYSKNDVALMLESFVNAVNGRNDGLGIDVYAALDMAMPGTFGYRSVLDGGRPVAIPDFRSASEREKFRDDHRCTDAKLASGDALLPSYSHGEIVVPDEVYEREAALLREGMEKRFHLGMN